MGLSWNTKTNTMQAKKGDVAKQFKGKGAKTLEYVYTHNVP